MEIPKDIQLLIKEYSMPIYKKPLHYKAYINNTNFNTDLSLNCDHPLIWRLNNTPYSLNSRDFAGSNFFNDVIIRGEFYNKNYNPFIN